MEISQQDRFDEAKRLLPLAEKQRLHLIRGSPWTAALGAFLAHGPDVGYWAAPRGYERGDLLLTVLDTEPHAALPRARAQPPTWP